MPTALKSTRDSFNRLNVLSCDIQARVKVKGAGPNWGKCNVEQSVDCEDKGLKCNYNDICTETLELLPIPWNCPYEEVTEYCLILSISRNSKMHVDAG